MFKQKKKNWITAIILALLVSICVLTDTTVLGATQKTGTIVTEWIVETKEEPSPSSPKVNGLENGKPVTILNEVTGSDGKTWYQIAYILKSNGELKTAYVPTESVQLQELVGIPSY